MVESRTRHPERMIAGIAICGTIMGPLAALLYEKWGIEPFVNEYLLNLWIVVAIAILGLSIGIYAIVRRVLLFGLACVILNSGVAALYGFMAVFFTLGGSR